MSSLGKWRLCFIVAILSLSPYQANAQTTAVTPAGDTVYLYNDGSYRIQKRTTKENLQLKSAVERLGKKHSASSREIEEAYSLASQGWRYTLPRPKSPQAAWGNTDGRTTWWYGYWQNLQTSKFSSTKPRISKAGVWIGDDQNLAGYYRRGGSPDYPNKIERILSDL